MLQALSPRRVTVLLMAGVAVASSFSLPAQAADKRMVTYDSVSPDARRLTGAGLTFVFTRQFFRTRILAVRATAVPVGIVPRPSNDGAVNRRLDALMGEDRGRGELYEIAADEAQGKVMIQAFCPGSTKGWLAIGAVNARKPLRVYAFGDDAATGDVKLCSTMDFSWRGEWQMPKMGPGNVTAAVARTDYGRPGT